jgi:hypothetical protein
MKKTLKVVSIDTKKTRPSAGTAKTQRIILQMGASRFAIDVGTQITRLPPENESAAGNRDRHEGGNNASERLHRDA